MTLSTPQSGLMASLPLTPHLVLGCVSSCVIPIELIFFFAIQYQHSKTRLEPNTIPQITMVGTDYKLPPLSYAYDVG